MELWKFKCLELPNETWEAIPGFEGWYEGSTLGRIRGVDRILRNGHKWKGKVLAQTIGTHGYLMISLFKNFVQTTQLVHILLANTFHLNPLNKPEVNHKDGNKLNNQKDNLEWNTKSENGLHSFRVLNRQSWTKGRRGADSIHSKPIDQYNMKGCFMASFVSQAEASNTTGICFKRISAAVTGRQKTAGGYIWKLKNP